jgi:hypothetical protein
MTDYIKYHAYNYDMLYIFYSFLVSWAVSCGEQTCGLCLKKRYGIKNLVLPLQLSSLRLRYRVKKYLENLSLETTAVWNYNTLLHLETNFRTYFISVINTVL